jgi:nitrate reductase beta subunit
MDIRAQLSMVLHLDKCIGCHTCSVTCKNLWTNRKGAEYMWWNNVETRPGTGYPKNWEDQEKYRGGWELKNGFPVLKNGSKWGILSRIFHNADQPVMKDYYEPFTYDYANLTDAPEGVNQPVARAKSRITGENINIESGPNWDDDLGGSSSYAASDPNFTEEDKALISEFEKVFMTYLPRLCNHCLNPACAAACPSGSIYKRGEDGIVLNDQEKCRAWRYCVSACPYKKIYYNWDRGKSEKCIFCYPKSENGEPSACAHSCVGRIRYTGVLLYDYDRLIEVLDAPEDTLVDALKSCILDPADPDIRKMALKAGIAPDWLHAAEESPVYAFVKEFGLALPLHPEFRTFPMVFYVPSLSPVLRKAETDMTMENLRIPVKYLASMFTAGNTKAVEDTLRKLLGIRNFMRGRELRDNGLMENGKSLSGWDGNVLEKAYRLTSLANFNGRFVIPKTRRENNCTYDMQGSEGFLNHENKRK